MAKHPHEPVPDREVRLTAKMMMSDRNRLRVAALRAGKPLEQMATEWLLERLEQEEPKPRRRP